MPTAARLLDHRGSSLDPGLHGLIDHLLSLSNDPTFLLFCSESARLEFAGANPAALRLIGYSLQEVSAQTVETLFGIDSKAFAALGRSPDDTSAKVIQQHINLASKTGQDIPCHLQVSPLREIENGHYCVAICRDLASADIESKIQPAIDKLAQMIFKGEDLENLFREITKSCDRLNAHWKSSIILLDKGNVMRHAAAPRLPRFYIDAIDGTEIGPGKGPCGTAMSIQQTLEFPSFASSALSERFKALAARANLDSCITNVIRSNSGEMLGAFAIYSDAPAEHRQAQREVVKRFANLVRFAIELNRKEQSERESQFKFQLIAQTVTDVFWIWDCKTQHTVFVSPAYERIWQRTCQSVIDDPSEFQRSVLAEDWPKFTDWGWVTEADDFPGQLEYRIVRPDGSLRWIRDRNYPIVDGNKKLDVIVTISTDITEEVETKRKLREEDERRLLANHVMSDALWDSDLRTGITWSSSGVGRIIGEDVSDGIQPKDFWWPRVHADDREKTKHSLQLALISDSSEWTAKYRILKQDGTIAWVLDRARITRDEFGRAIRVTGNTNDISAVHAMEEQLAQAQRLEVVGQLTGGIAHDFNNLLTVIIGNADVLMSQPGANDDVDQASRLIHSAAIRGAALTDRLLTFARRQTLASVPIAIGHLLEDMRPLIRHGIGENVQIETRVAESGWLAYADRALLEGAILNLCLNSRDAMTNGGVLSIETGARTIDCSDLERYPDLAKGDYVSIVVRDTGSGMDEETMKRAFEPFFTTKGRGKGNGLGLSMVYGFAKQSGGHASISSELGRGTAVELLLPRAQGETTAASTESDHDGGVSRSGTVLVVEDDELVRQSVSLQLTRLGYSVVAVADGFEALGQLRMRGGFDLMLTDVVMPGQLNGIQLAERVAEIDARLPILFTSGYAEETLGEAPFPIPADRLLRKPYQRSELASALRRAMAQARDTELQRRS